MNVIPFPQGGGNSKPKRALIVEDESLMALLLEHLLQELGYDVVGICASIHDALSLINKESFDFAILDINLRGVESYEVADKLDDHRIPFIISTGYDALKLLKPYREYPTLQKPYELQSLKIELNKLHGFHKKKILT
jgi:CheY-like chemotaxis protein